MADPTSLNENLPRVASFPRYRKYGKYRKLSTKRKTWKIAENSVFASQKKKKKKNIQEDHCF